MNNLRLTIAVLIKECVLKKPVELDDRHRGPLEGTWAHPASYDAGEVDIARTKSTIQLGTVLDNTGASMPMEEHRMAAAERAYFFDVRALRDSNTSRALRFERYNTRILPAMLFSLECMAPAPVILQKLHSYEGGLLRKVAKLKQDAAETVERFMRRSARKARELYITGGFLTVEERVFSTFSARSRPRSRRTRRRSCRGSMMRCMF